MDRRLWCDVQNEGGILDEIPFGVSVLVDANPIIYPLENHPRSPHGNLPLFEAAQEGRYELVISTVTLSEVIAGRSRTNNEILIERYEQVLTTGTGWHCRAIDGVMRPAGPNPSKKFDPLEHPGTNLRPNAYEISGTTQVTLARNG